MRQSIGSYRFAVYTMEGVSIVNRGIKELME